MTLNHNFKYLIIVLLVCGAFACGENDKTVKLDALKQQRAALDKKIEMLENQLKVHVDKPLVSVTVLPVKRQMFIHEIEVQGKIESDRNILVPAEASGVLKRIYVKEGDQVKLGQVMAQVDDDILVSQMKEVQGNLALAKNIFERTARLYKQQIGSEVDYLQAKNKMEDLESSLVTLKTQIAKTRITAPFAGRVDKVSSKEGEAVNAGSGVIRVVHASKLKVVVNLSENYITSVAKGQDVKVYFPTINQTLHLKITAVSNVIDVNNRTFAIELSLPSAANLYPNMYAVITIQDYVNPNAIIVPEKNIVAYQNKSHVYLLSKDAQQKPIAEFKEVKVGVTANAETEILEGLQVGDQFIAQGYTQLSDGQGVQVNH